MRAAISLASVAWGSRPADLADVAISRTFGATVLKSFSVTTQEADQGLPSSKSMVA
jgi:hypothetical protein